MKADLIFYIIAVCTVVFTYGATFLLPVTDSYRSLITLPGLIALFGIVIEAWRDKRAHEKALELLTRQQDNSLAIASHMATVIFDRQVKFCEDYFEKVYSTLMELFTNGPTPTALILAKELWGIRTRFSPWLSPQIESDLLPFEKALREVGVDAQLTSMDLPQPQHELFVRRMYKAFMNITDIKESNDGDSPEEAISAIIVHLRNMLGVDQLTKLRDQAISMATIRAEPTFK